ncbi:arsenate reductase/protein-tyrosine-phosphatase family protein [Agrococcus sp. KRD186]|uniref:arsenate reductase/protein-tyrosine-phosphatase family protein n=1 Tax=Agrococcus sp. KRD186 TaxID=2729730 RepID=UPI0019D1C3C4|nr:low molecular weight phosphatase family protein [Agrococcus sp. KRD186]
MPLPSRPSSEPTIVDGVFRILTVCSGNLCRSPQAEQLLRARIAAAFGRSAIPALAVASAGTKARDGDPMDKHAAAEAVRLGVADSLDHRARRIVEQYVAEADLILGMAREHRGAAASLVPSANRRVFTLVEFARIVEALASGSGVDIEVTPLGADGFAAFMRRVVAAAVTARGLMPVPEDPLELDVEDPYRLEPEVYRRSADAVEAHIERMAVGLRSLARGTH